MSSSTSDGQAIAADFGPSATMSRPRTPPFNVYNRRNEWFITYDPDDLGVDPDVIKMLPIVPTLGINFGF